MCISFFWTNAIFLELANLNHFGQIGALCPKGWGVGKMIRQGELKNALVSSKNSEEADINRLFREKQCIFRKLPLLSPFTIESRG